MNEPVYTVVLGAGGYVGGELLRLIASHPTFELAAAVSDSRTGQPIGDTFGHLASVLADATFVGSDTWPDSTPDGSNVALFSAAPHGASAAIIAAALDAADKKNFCIHVVDCSADFRYRNQAEWESVYGLQHGAPDLLQQFSCAVPEHRVTADTPHIGHPGCFATAMLLASVPLISSGLTDAELFISGVTGSTGSGRSPQAGTHHPERNSNFYAYKPLAHRHAPEVAGLTSTASGRETAVHFVPHSGPFARGIHVTVHARTSGNVTEETLRNVFLEAYTNAPFVEVLSAMPKIKNVVASNMCHLSVATDANSVVVSCVIDNLVKGAAGGAMQWMNRLWQLPDTSGLTAPAPGWT